MNQAIKVVVLALLASCMCSACSPFGGCERVDRKSVRSPSGHIATVFEVRCGATASNATCVSVRTRGWFKKEKTVFVATSLVPAEIVWLTDKILEVRHDADRIEAQAMEMDGVTIRYGNLEEQAEAKKPNQALQTTPVTRNVYEKTTEFGDHQRGV